MNLLSRYKLEFSLGFLEVQMLPLLGAQQSKDGALVSVGPARGKAIAERSKRQHDAAGDTNRPW